MIIMRSVHILHYNRFPSPVSKLENSCARRIMLYIVYYFNPVITMKSTNKPPVVTATATAALWLVCCGDLPCLKSWYSVCNLYHYCLSQPPLPPPALRITWRVSPRPVSEGQDVLLLNFVIQTDFYESMQVLFSSSDSINVTIQHNYKFPRTLCGN